MTLITKIREKLEPDFDSLIGNNLTSLATDSKGVIVWASDAFIKQAGEVKGLNISEAVKLLFDDAAEEAVEAVCDTITRDHDSMINLKEFGFQVRFQALSFFVGKRVAATFIKQGA